MTYYNSIRNNSDAQIQKPKNILESLKNSALLCVIFNAENTKCFAENQSLFISPYLLLTDTDVDTLNSKNDPDDFRAMIQIRRDKRRERGIGIERVLQMGDGVKIA